MRSQVGAEGPAEGVAARQHRQQVARHEEERRKHNVVPRVADLRRAARRFFLAGGGPAFCFWRGAAQRFVFGPPRQGRPVRGEAARLPRRRLSPRMRTGTKGDRAAGSTPPTWYHCIMWHQTDVFEPVCLSRPRVIKLLKRTTVSNESMTPPSARVRMDGPLPTSTTRPSP